MGAIGLCGCETPAANAEALRTREACMFLHVAAGLFQDAPGLDRGSEGSGTR